LCYWASENLTQLSKDDCDRLRQFSVILDDEVTEDEQWQVYAAIREGNDLTKFQLWPREDLISFRNPLGETFLHTACRCNNTAAARQLLWLGASMDVKSRRGETPLHVASRFGAGDCAKLLLDYDCEVDAANLWECTPLMWAVRSENCDAHRIIDMLLQNGASINAVDKDGWTVLHCLTQSNIDLKTAKERYQLLEKYGAQRLLNVSDATGTTPIVSAIFWHNAAVLKVYLDADARTDMISNRRNILHYAAAYGTREVMEVLSSTCIKGVDIRSTSGDGSTPLSALRWRSRNVRNINTGYGEFRLEEGADGIFENLLRAVRDQNIREEAMELERIVEFLELGHFSTAKEILATVMVQKQQAGIFGEAETFRVICLQVTRGMIEPAIESLREFCEVSFARLKTSLLDECQEGYLNSNLWFLDKLYESREDDGTFDTSSKHEETDCSLQMSQDINDSRQHNAVFVHKASPQPPNQGFNFGIGRTVSDNSTNHNPHRPIINMSHLDARKSY
jgi:ankyrin repeat protein